jgi:glycosyltransferase involved in cell wall biosynthesis
MPTATPPKILLLIPHLGGGGAEQVMTLLARELSHQKYELHLGLITQEKRGEEALPPWVTVHALGAARVRSGLLPLLHLVRQLKPEVILSGMAHLNFLVLLLRPFFPRGTQVLVRQNATVSAALSFGDLPFYTRFLYRRLYRHADRIICQTRAMADDLAFELGVARERIVVLANPVDLEGILAAERDPVRWSGEGPHLLAIGRLSREKGFDLLLESLSAVQHRFPSADLTILGAGPEEQALKELSRTLGLEAVVRFAGQVERPYGFFPGATLLVLSSRSAGTAGGASRCLARRRNLRIGADRGAAESFGVAEAR